MAIEKTRALQRLEVYPGIGDEDPRVMVVYENTFDDVNDDELPVVQTQVKYLTSDVDYSGEDTLVVSVCDAIWG
jgi:hypothetical protein